MTKTILTPTLAQWKSLKNKLNTGDREAFTDKDWAQMWGDVIYDPENPTLEGVKAAVGMGDYAVFPVGTEIPDTYDGESNPLIIVQYLDSSNNSSYGGVEGAILLRKYTTSTSIAFGNNANYLSAAIQSSLNGDYYNKCSTDLKNVISPISVPQYYRTSPIMPATLNNVSGNFFLASTTEMGQIYGEQAGEGFQWDYFKTNGIGATTTTGNRGQHWSRTQYVYGGSSGSNLVCVVWFNSMNSTYNMNMTNSANSSLGLPLYIRPACFISKS